MSKSRAGELLSQLCQFAPYVGETNGSMTTTLSRALEVGALAIFVLECVPSEPILKPTDQELLVGKIPLPANEVVSTLPMLALENQIGGIIGTLAEFGVDTHLYVAVGDDDFEHSVDPQLVSDEAMLRGRVQGVLGAMEAALSSAYSSSLQEVWSWLTLEQSGSVDLYQRGKVRQAVEGTVLTRVAYGSTRLVQDRYTAMLNWRQDLLQFAGYSADKMGLYLAHQAFEELTSYVFQLQQMPGLVKRAEGLSVPILYLNTFPGQNRNDYACVKLAKDTGLKSMYSMLGFDSTDKSVNIPQVCGDPKGWKGSK